MMSAWKTFMFLRFGKVAPRRTLALFQFLLRNGRKIEIECEFAAGSRKDLNGGGGL
jgi:hypothetical protein